MIRTISVVLLVVYAYISPSMISCTKEESLPGEVGESVTRVILPTGDSPATGKKDASIGNTSTTTTEALAPKVPPSQEESLLRIINVNLDLDQQEEQVLVLKLREDPSAFIRIAVIDYESVTESYIRTWEGTTGITKLRSLDVSLADLTGDHNFEILCAGVGRNNLHNLTAFRRTTSENMIGLHYTEIFSLDVDGTIEIAETTRDNAYRSGMRDGKSFPIIATTIDPESDEVLYRIKSTYHWDFSSLRYLMVKEERLPGERIEEAQLRQLYRGTLSDFTAHIDGPWVYINDPDYLIVFDKSSESATFVSSEVLEVYNWRSTYKRLGNFLQIGAQNDLIIHVEREINVKLIDTTTLEISIRDIDTRTRKKTLNEIWTGRYLSQNLQAEPEVDYDKVEHPALFGKYIGETGAELIFSENSFRYRSDVEEFQGGIALYLEEVPIITLRIIERNQLPSESRVYRYEFEERDLGNTIQRVLTLYPGVLMFYGFEPTGEEPLKFQQIEIVEEP